jgi:hypothetical protein
MSTNTFKIIEGFAGLGFSLAGLGALFDAGMKQVTQASTSSNTWVPTSVFDTFGGFATPIPYAVNTGSSGNPDSYTLSCSFLELCCCFTLFGRWQKNYKVWKV